MTDGELLEKVCNVAEKWSKPYLVTVGGYLLSTLIIALNVTDWVVANARDNLGALIAFGIGGILTGAVVASLFWRHVLKKSVDAKDAEVELVRNEANAEADLAEMRRKVNEGDYYARVDLRILAEDGTITLMWIEPGSEVTFYDMFAE